MLNKILLALSGIVFLVLITTFFSNDSQTKIKKNNTKIIKPAAVQNNDIEILYLDNNKNDKKKKNAKHTKIHKKEIKEIENEKNLEKNIESLQYEEIKQYIEKKDLQDISPSENLSSENIQFKVYANVNAEEAKRNKDNSLPPLAPVIYTVTFPSGTTTTVVVDGDINNQTRELIVVNNDEDGNSIEAQQIKQSDELEEKNTNIIFSAPPSIGSN